MSNIYSIDRMGQVIDFDGMEACGKEWMDVDSMCEYENLGFIFCEFKYGNAPMGIGQRIALERLANALQSAGKETLIMLCSHRDEVPNVIKGNKATVRAVYYDGKWRNWKLPDNSVKNVAETFIREFIRRSK